MSEQIEKPKDDASDEKVSPAAAACVAGIAGLAVGTLAGGPLLGIALAAIWGIQAAVCEASGHEVNSNDVS
jgi:hypothetical protein